MIYSEPQTTLLSRGYTFHEHLDEFDLINMNGRAYDPVVGRFLSADIVVQNPEHTQGYNRYSYCLNNPLKYNDPSGYSYDPSGGLFSGYHRPFFSGLDRNMGNKQMALLNKAWLTHVQSENYLFNLSNNESNEADMQMNGCNGLNGATLQTVLGFLNFCPALESVLNIPKHDPDPPKNSRQENNYPIETTTTTVTLPSLETLAREIGGSDIKPIYKGLSWAGFIISSEVNIEKAINEAMDKKPGYGLRLAKIGLDETMAVVSLWYPVGTLVGTVYFVVDNTIGWQNVLNSFILNNKELYNFKMERSYLYGYDPSPWSDQPFK